LGVVDKDGSKAYSKVLSINNYQLSTITVFPNPTKGEVNISLPENSKWQIEATDITGRIIWEQVCNSCEGIIKHELIGSKGLYFIKVTNVITGQQVIKKISLQ
jgi:hypothetical protein